MAFKRAGVSNIMILLGPRVDDSTRHAVGRWEQYREVEVVGRLTDSDCVFLPELSRTEIVRVV